MKKNSFCVITLLLGINSFLIAQLSIENLSKSDADLIYIIPSDSSLKTKGVCYEIVNKSLIKSSLKKFLKTNLNYKIYSQIKYDIFLIDTADYGGYQNIFVKYNVELKKKQIIKFFDNDINFENQYDCTERAMYKDEVNVDVKLINKSNRRVLKVIEYNSSKNSNDMVHNITPWKMIFSGQSIIMSFSYIKKSVLPKQLKCKVWSEKGGIIEIKEYIIDFKDTGMLLELN